MIKKLIFIIVGLAISLSYIIPCYAQPVNEFTEKEGLDNGKTKMTILSYPKYYKNGNDYVLVDKRIVPSDNPQYDWMVRTGVYEVYIKNNGKFKYSHKQDSFEMQLRKIVHKKQSGKDDLDTLNFSNPIVQDNTITWTLPNGINYKMVYGNDQFRDILTIPKAVKNTYKKNSDDLGLQYEGKPILKYVKKSVIYGKSYDKKTQKDKWEKKIKIEGDNYYESIDMKALNSVNDLEMNSTLNVDYTGIQDCENQQRNPNTHSERLDSDGMGNREYNSQSSSMVNPVRVDLSDLPSGADVSSASIQYMVGYITGSGSPSVIIYSFTGTPGLNWSDTTCDWYDYSGTSDWTNTDGGRDDVADALNTAITNSSDESFDTFTFNATGLSFVEGGATDDIEMLIINSATYFTRRLQYRPIEDSTSAKRPSFTCEYTAAGSAIKTVNGLAKASVKTIDGLAIASVKTWNGLE